MAGPLSQSADERARLRTPALLSVDRAHWAVAQRRAWASSSHGSFPSAEPNKAEAATKTESAESPVNRAESGNDVGEIGRATPRSPFSCRIYALWVRAVSFASSKHLQTSRRDLGLWDSRTWIDLHAPTQIRLLRESVVARAAATESSAWKSPSLMSFSPEFVATSRNPRVMVLPPSSRTLPSWSIKPLGRQSSPGHTS